MATTYTLCRGSKWIAAGWIGFITENLVLSENRQYIIDNYGKDKYMAAYSSLSALSCGSIGYGLLRYGIGQSPFARSRSAVAYAAGLVLQTTGAVLLSQTLPPFQIPVELTGGTSSSSSSSSGSGAAGPISPPKEGMSFALRCPIDFEHSRNEKSRKQGSEEGTSAWKTTTPSMSRHANPSAWHRRRQACTAPIASRGTPCCGASGW